MTIKITQDHIKRGTITYGHCPIALAIKDLYAKPVTVLVSKDYIGTYEELDSFNKYKPCRKFKHNEQTLAFLEAFDNHRPVEPFTTTLEQI